MYVSIMEESSYAMLDNIEDADGNLEGNQADDVPLRLGGLHTVDKSIVGAYLEYING